MSGCLFVCVCVCVCVRVCACVCQPQVTIRETECVSRLGQRSGV